MLLEQKRLHLFPAVPPRRGVRLTVSTEQCGLAGVDFGVHLPAEVVQAALRDAARAERRRVAQQNYDARAKRKRVAHHNDAARAERKRVAHHNDAGRAEHKRRGFRFWKANTASEGSDSSSSNSNSNRGSGNSSSSKGSGGSSSGSGNNKTSGAGRDGRGVWSKAFRAFSAWREKHRDAAQELLDGPWV